MTFGLTQMMGRGLLAAALVALLAACNSAPAVVSPSPSPTPTIAVVASPSASATPTAEPGLWRIEGYVVNEAGQPMQDVCVVVGPNGCRQFSPHTDAKGHWFLDIAVGQATFDFHFVTPGYVTQDWHVTPVGPTQYNLVMDKE
ncbi:MAG TPA: hypothetical protein VEZ15_01345 [Acidimicrobiia bacterium]|nr:hypothetical protein [Acidimicrobiia bacterium]